MSVDPSPQREQPRVWGLGFGVWGSFCCCTNPNYPLIKRLIYPTIRVERFRVQRV